MRFFIFMICGILMFPLVAAADPFGIFMGDKPSDKKFKNFNTLEGSPNYLIGSNPPKAHSAFEKYVIQFSDSSGACWVKALGKDLNSDSYGIQTKSTIDKLAAQISKKYGAYSKTDRLLPGSIWDDADDWMTGLKQNERIYMYSWDADSGASFSDTSITQIYLAAKSSGGGDGYPVLEFYYENHGICKSEKERVEEDAF